MCAQIDVQSVKQAPYLISLYRSCLRYFEVTDVLVDGRIDCDGTVEHVREEGRRRSRSLFSLLSLSLEMLNSSKLSALSLSLSLKIQKRDFEIFDNRRYINTIFLYFKLK